MKIATWNINSLKVRLPHVLDWLAVNQPDVLALQETKLQDVDFPITEIQEAGYNVIFSGQKTYNGVAILSKNTPENIIMDVPALVDPQRRILVASVHDIRIINLYIPNGQSVGSDKYAYKLDWLAKITNFIAEELQQHKKLIVLGDFNIAPEDRDVHEPGLWQDQVLCSEPERAAFKQLLQLGLADSFRLFEQPEKIYSWWDYRMLAFQRNRGLRIDHILVSEALKAQCQSCVIDKAERKKERPSDHAPVIALL